MSEEVTPSPRRGWLSGWLLGRARRADGGRWFPATLNEQIEVLLKLTLIVGAVLAVIEYMDRRQDLRVARSLAFYERFDDERYMLARAAVRNAIVEINNRQARAGEPADPSLRAGYHAAEGKGVMTEISEITGFFNGLEACIAEQLCDGDAAVRFQGAYARSFWDRFQRVVYEERLRGAPDYAAGFERFVDRARVGREGGG